MRIALIAGSWYTVPPAAYGGTEEVVDWLARGFYTAGHEVLLYTIGDSTCPVPKAWNQESSSSDRMGQSITELFHLQAAYERVADFDIIHDHTVIGPAYGVNRVSGKLIATNHGPFVDDRREIYRRMATEGVPVIAISHDQASRSATPVAAVIHHGLPPDEFPMGGGKGDYFLFLGRFDPIKGVREAALMAHKAGVPLLIAAKMHGLEEEQYFHEQVEPLLDSTVQYVGEVDKTEKVRLLRSARALLNPIQWPEPFGLVMIEALSCGTPVLTYRRGAAPEIIDHGRTGFLCADEDEMVAALQRADVLDRDECRASVLQRFSMDRMVSEHLALFERLLENR